jgi:hypothetical protein
MPETLKDCRCIDHDDKHELSKTVIARIELYRKGISEIETEGIIEQIENLGIEEREFKPSSKSVKKISQYKDIINRLEGLHNRLENTPEC